MSVKKAIFVSDVHLALPEQPQWDAFYDFLQGLIQRTDISDLFLVGDIFDLWVGNHKYFKITFRPFIKQFEALIEQGVRIHYFEGNHDLHLKYFWEQELGAKVYSGPGYFELYGHGLRVEHGDQMDPTDRGYHFLRWFLRTPIVRFIILHMPGPLVARIGDWASKSSRRYTTEVKSINTDELQEVVEIHTQGLIKKYEQRQILLNTLISGHIHTKMDFEQAGPNGPVRVINLGTWLKGHTPILELDQDGVRWW